MSTTAKRLTRSRDDRWLGGVCGGIAQYFGIDANLVRLVVFVATLFASPLIIAYIVAVFLIPREDQSPTVVSTEDTPTV